MVAYGKQLETQARRRSRVDIMMTPMIDVVFLLIIFFLVTSSFAIAEKLLPSAISQEATLSSGVSDENQDSIELSDFNDVVVRIRLENGQPTLELTGTPVADLPALAQRLRAILKIKPEVPVIVHPDDEVTMDVNIAVFDLARQSGGVRVFFATK